MEIQIQGYVAPGFGRVADAFRANFLERGERGAACTVMIDGAPVIDIFAGYARGGAPWSSATRCVAFSVSKAVTAICVLMAAERGLLDLDEAVATYWPEFAVHGKDRVTVRQVLAHRAGLPAPAAKFTAQELQQWFPVTDALAGQVPVWEPNSTFAYHPITVGFLAGEVLRRTTGLRPSEWLAKYVAAPLELGLTYGGDVNAENFAPVLHPTESGDGIPLSAEDQNLVERAMLVDGAYSPDIFTAANSMAFLGPESPAANIVGSARDLARLFSATVCLTAGTRLLSPATVSDAAKPVSYGKPYIGPDKGDIWGTGFMVHSSRRGMAGPGSFGHDGAAGQLGFAEPSSALGFAYQTIQPGGDEDIRAEILAAAVRACL